jgi:hypothetical protein
MKRRLLLSLVPFAALLLLATVAPATWKALVFPVLHGEASR